MGPLGGRGWHPISHAASPLLDVPIPPRIQTCPSPADTPQGSPTPTLSLTSKLLPVLPPSAQPPAASPPPVHLPSFPIDLCPSPTMHLPLLEAGGHAPALTPESLRLRLALLSCLRGRWGTEAPRAPPRPLPSQAGGGARFFYSGNAGTRPLFAHAYCSLGGGGWSLWPALGRSGMGTELS